MYDLSVLFTTNIYVERCISGIYLSFHLSSWHLYVVYSISPPCSVQFSRSVMSDSLWPRELQHARPPYPSPTPGFHSNSLPSSWWCHQAISSSVRYADDSTHMAESEEELKSILMKVKEESEKVGLKHNIQKTKIMASGPITSWEINGETVETVSDFIFGGSKVTADGDYSHEIKRCLLLGRKDMTNLDSILKRRNITLPRKVHLVKAMVFPVVLYGCESWTVKKTECRRIDAFELWYWRRLLRVPWTARRSNQSILKEISPVYSLEGLMLKLKL